MGKKEQTNGSSKISFRIGEVITNEEKKITMPPKKAKKIDIITIARLNELEENEYLELRAEPYDIIKNIDGTLKRIDSKTGKELTSNQKDKEEVR